MNYLTEERFLQLYEAVMAASGEHSRITTDRKYMEAVARDRLNLQREGEYIIQIKR